MSGRSHGLLGVGLAVLVGGVLGKVLSDWLPYREPAVESGNGLLPKGQRGRTSVAISSADCESQTVTTDLRDRSSGLPTKLTDRVAMQVGLGAATLMLGTSGLVLVQWGLVAVTAGWTVPCLVLQVAGFGLIVFGVLDAVERAGPLGWITLTATAATIVGGWRATTTAFGSSPSSWATGGWLALMSLGIGGVVYVICILAVHAHLRRAVGITAVGMATVAASVATFLS